MHKFSTAATKSSALSALHSVGLLNVPYSTFAGASVARLDRSALSSLRDKNLCIIRASYRYLQIQLIRQAGWVFVLALLCALAGARVMASPQEVGAPHLSDRILNYRIEVGLDPLEKKVKGYEILTWRNQSGKALQDFCFHLYLNAFRNNRSTFVRESSFRPLWGRIEEIPDDYWGYTNVESIQVISGQDAFRPQVIRRQYIHPDDDNEMDRSVLRIVLDRPLPAGEVIEFRIDFESKLPKGTRRTGWKDDYFFVAQWFPKIGVVQEGQWNCHQYHQSTEYFADFGVYDVSLTVPTQFVVGATGKRVDQRDNSDGTTTYRYLQEDVHDFAWTASPRFLEKKRRFSHPPLPEVDMTLLLLPEHRHLEERYFAGYPTRSSLLWDLVWSLSV